MGNAITDLRICTNDWAFNSISTYDVEDTFNTNDLFIEFSTMLDPKTLKPLPEWLSISIKDYNLTSFYIADNINYINEFIIKNIIDYKETGDNKYKEILEVEFEKVTDEYILKNIKLSDRWMSELIDCVDILLKLELVTYNK